MFAVVTNTTYLLPPDYHKKFWQTLLTLHCPKDKAQAPMETQDLLQSRPAYESSLTPHNSHSLYSPTQPIQTHPAASIIVLLFPNQLVVLDPCFANMIPHAGKPFPYLSAQKIIFIFQDPPKKSFFTFLYSVAITPHWEPKSTFQISAMRLKILHYLFIFQLIYLLTPSPHVFKIERRDCSLFTSINLVSRHRWCSENAYWMKEASTINFLML